MAMSETKTSLQIVKGAEFSWSVIEMVGEYQAILCEETAAVKLGHKGE